MTTIIKLLPLILLGLGGIITWISFTNEDNVTGMWVAGKDFRDKEFKDKEKFYNKTYFRLRIIGIILLLFGVALFILT